MVFVGKNTAKRLHEECHKGEKHDNFINRLIDSCEEAKEDLNITPGTMERLVKFTGSIDADEALNTLIEQYKRRKNG